jgi:hypothetical protein
MDRKRVSTRVAIALAATLAALSAIAALWLTSVHAERHSLNPEYIALDPAHDAIVAYNWEDQKLWEVPSRGIPDAAQWERATGIPLSQVIDINDDGMNEVVTVVQFLNEEQRRQDLVTFFSADRRVNHTVAIGRDVCFRTEVFRGGRGVTGLIIDDFAGDGSKHICARGSSAHSPSFITRLDAHGTPLGEYWHYGDLPWMYAVDMHYNGSKQLILCGRNDTGGPPDSSFAVVVVLDATKISMVTESSASRGFGFPRSKAELFYLRFPRTCIEDAIHSCPTAGRMTVGTSDEGDLLNFEYFSQEGDTCSFEYTFSADLIPVRVRANDHSIRIPPSFPDPENAAVTIQESYLDSLRNSVQYWDGHIWRNSVTTVTQEETSP